MNPWNKGKLIGQKPPLKLKEIWAIRIHLQLSKRYRDIALFNLDIASKLRACDLVRLKVSDVLHADQVARRWPICRRCRGLALREKARLMGRDAARGDSRWTQPRAPPK